MKKRYIYGTLQLVLGFLFIVLGMFTYTQPGSVLATLIYVYGFSLILTGIVGIIFYFTVENRMGFSRMSSLIMGILNVIFGFILVSNIWASIIALAFIFPFWFIFMCISRLFNLGFIKAFAGTGESILTLIINVFGIIIGFYLLFNPATSILTISILVSTYLILSGVEMIVFAFGYFKK